MSTPVLIALLSLLLAWGLLMGSSYPDWGKAAPVETIVPIADIGELAARLGSIVTYDRRGNVFWLDDFEDNLAKYLFSINGAGAAAALSTAAAHNGDTSLELDMGTTSSGLIKFTRTFGSPPASRWGLEVSFSLPAGQDSLLLQIWPDGPAYAVDARVKYDLGSGELQLYTTGGTYQTLAVVGALTQGAHVWHTLKLVIDMTGPAYVRVLLDGSEYDASGIALPGSGITVPSQTRLQLQVVSAAGGNKKWYIDDLIFTQNEP